MHSTSDEQPRLPIFISISDNLQSHLIDRILFGFLLSCDSQTLSSSNSKFVLRASASFVLNLTNEDVGDDDGFALLDGCLNVTVVVVCSDVLSCCFSDSMNLLFNLRDRLTMSPV